MNASHYVLYAFCAVCAVGIGWLFTVLANHRAGESPKQWSECNRYHLRGFKRRRVMAGPFFPSLRGQVVLKFRSVTSDGNWHEGWARCTGGIVGRSASDKIEVKFE